MTEPLTREQIVALDKKWIWHPYTPMGPYLAGADPIVVERASGLYLYDKNGARLIDANGSWWVSLLGHNHPRLMQALREQTERVAHCSFAGITHEGAVRLAAQLLPRCGPKYERIFYSDDGSTAVEAALRIARQYWQLLARPQKQKFVSLSHAFHGETVGAASVSGTAVFHQALGDMLFDCIRLPSPGAPHAGSSNETWYESAFAQAEELISSQAADIAAVIVEPLVQGAAGMLVYPPQYLKRLAELCRSADVLLIADEVFVGYGRTGTFLAQHQAAVEADIVCLAKGFSGGVLPMAATVVTGQVFAPFKGGAERTLWYGHSFTGNPLGAAVALEVLNVLDDERLLETVPQKAAALAEQLASVAEHPFVRCPRHAGLIAAFTLERPDAASADSRYHDDAGWRFSAAARRLGAHVRPLGNVVYFVLPLTVEISQIAELFDIVRAALAECFGAR